MSGCFLLENGSDLLLESGVCLLLESGASGDSTVTAGVFVGTIAHSTPTVASTVTSLAVVGVLTRSSPTVEAGVTYPSVVIGDMPWSYLRLEDAAAQATLVDSSGNSRPGTTGTDNVGSGLGRVNNAASWNRSTTAAVISTTQSNPTTFTIEAWFRTVNSGGIAQFTNSSDPQALSGSQHDRRIDVVADGNIDFGGYDPAITSNPFVRIRTAGIDYRDGLWHHVVATQAWDGSNSTKVLYVDGVQRATRTDASVGVENFTGNWRFGRNEPGIWSDTNNVGVDSLDECAIYTTALTATQVAAHYTAATGAVVHVGAITRSTPTVDLTATSRTVVGVLTRSTATVDVSATSFTVVGVLARSSPSVDTDVTVVGLTVVGAITRSTATVDVSASSLTVVGVLTRSSPTVEAVTAARTDVGAVTRTSPTVAISAATLTVVGVLTQSSPLDPFAALWGTACATVAVAITIATITAAKATATRTAATATIATITAAKATATRTAATATAQLSKDC